MVLLRKKRLRERESETDDMSDREDSNIEEEKDDGEILAVYSASPSSSERLPETECTPKERLVAEPFSISGQNDQESRSRRVIWRNIETNSDTILGQLCLVLQSSTYRCTLWSEMKKEVKKE